ncbi:MAG: 4-(cytidine 5'-diphospho)-2-C-methyl-D-erythritol kinase [Eubacterium sp.]|nr:4-(cytidine 5'-diphospho)-2-C-methyl-D-erythritol kinase [Clostridiales bacterium]MDY3774578.1 4-(cytidine 5'-diphospho)-2-C-methyl-D-erythritol kinase [Eubacterium sp.]
MDSTWINAPAKINLGLDVVRRREDGYHEVKMIMQSIRLFDRLTLKKTRTPGISLTTNLHFLPVNEDNLVYKSARLLMEEFGITEGLSIFLDKRIPVAAGMAGGSTDAASCMLAMNRLFHLGLSLEELKTRGVTLGADIPYCLQKGTALSEGIGEILSPLPAAPDCYVLIAKPGFHVSTKFVYSNLVLDENTVHPDIDKMLDCIQNRDLHGLCHNMANILETVTIPAHPDIALIKQTMMENGALGALMSGSGPTVFGIYEDQKEAMRAKEICRSLPCRCFVYVTDFYR